MKKHVLARALALVMSLSLLSSTALAAVVLDKNAINEDGSLKVQENGSFDYYLESDLNLDKTLIVNNGSQGTINLNGWSIVGNGSSSVIKVTGAGTDLTLTDTQVENAESGENGTITGGGGNTGGGVHVNDHASVTMNGGTITGNNVGQNGGGVFIQNGGSFTLNDGAEISDNSAGHSGGGVFVNGYKDWDNAQFMMNGGVISGNIAGNGSTGSGGGIGAYVTGGQDRDKASVVINGGEITDNRVNYAGSNGAGIAVANGSLTMTGGTVTGNTGVNYGGGIYLHDSDATISGSKIENNVANFGGGVWASGSSDVTLKNDTISGNKATNDGGGIYVNKGSLVDASENNIIYNNTASRRSDDVFKAQYATLKLPSAASMNVIGSDGKPITGWYFDANGRWSTDGTHPYTTQEKWAVGAVDNYKNQLNLKAAHDQYFTLSDGYGNKLANEEKGTEINLNEIEAPTRNGWEFIGWADENDNIVSTVKIVKDTTLIAQWEHVDHNGQTVRENEVPAQIGVAGSYDEVSYCTECGAELSRVTVTIPALEEPEEPSEPTEPEEPVDPEEPTEPEEPGVVIPDPDVPMGGAPDADTVDIEDEEVPLAGMMSTAQLLEELRVHEEIADVELPEDFKFMDHDYAQAIFWALSEELVADTEEEPLDPDEIVTVGLMRKVLNAFAVNCKGYEDFATAIEGEDDEIVMDLGERLNLFYEELEQYEAE